MIDMPEHGVGVCRSSTQATSCSCTCIASHREKADHIQETMGSAISWGPYQLKPIASPSGGGQVDPRTLCGCVHHRHFIIHPLCVGHRHRVNETGSGWKAYASLFWVCLLECGCKRPPDAAAEPCCRRCKCIGVPSSSSWPSIRRRRCR